MNLKEMAATRELKLGTCVAEFATPGIGHICKAAGCDFVFFDMEHAGFSLETVKSMVRYMEAADMPILVRPPVTDYYHIASLCDIGVEAILLPHLRSPEQAIHAIDCMRYPPEGHRGACFGIAHDRYSSDPVGSKIKGANQTLALYGTIEDVEGLKNVDQIAAVEGVDGLWIGHNDLTTSLGIPGQYDDPEFLEAVEAISEACLTNGKSYGRLVTSVEEGQSLFAAGADMIAFSGDVWLLVDALRAPLDELRKELVGEAGGSL